MTIEHFIITAVAAISIASAFYIPKDKYRLAFISFLTAQAVTWASSLVLIQIGLFEYPVREFPRATQGSFISLFLFAPIIYTWFIIAFPNNASIIIRIPHYFIFISIIVWYVYFISVYTDLANFLKLTTFWHILFMYFRFLIYFIICRIYILWFSKKTNLPAGG